MGTDYFPIEVSEKAPLCEASGEFALAQEYRRLRRYVTSLLAIVTLSLFLIILLFVLLVARGISDAQCTAKIQGWCKKFG
jgi:drug/metabolite transporter superfamily protein YnfA